MLIIKVDLQDPDNLTIQKTGEILKGGGIIIFPTDTVYGLGCNAFDESAIKKVFTLKERPTSKPLPVLINSPDQLADLISGQVPKPAQKIIQEFWPGALTLIFPANKRISKMITGYTQTVGVRMPRCNFILELISLIRLPLVATSVNISGQPVSGEIKHVISEWKNKADLILDGGDRSNLSASTVLDLTVYPPKILREGAIGREQLHAYLGAC